MRKFIIEYEVSTPRKVVLGGFWFMKSFWNVKKYITSIFFFYGIRNGIYKWYEDYSRGRKQYPTYNAITSDMEVIKCGVPKGYVNFIVLLYIRLSQGVKWLFPILFADDIFYKKDMEEMTNELEKVRSWLNCNNLSIDVSKTHHMTIGLRNKCIDDADIRINHVVTQMVFVIKFLSLLIDSKLN